MFIMTESVKSLLSELASAGHMEVEMDGDRLHVTVDCGSQKKGCKSVRNAGSSRPAPKEPSRPYFGKKRGRKAMPKYRTVNGRRTRVYTWNGKAKTTAEWAAEYDCTPAAIESRFRLHGSPETIRRRSKSDRTSLKAKLAGGAE